MDRTCEFCKYQKTKDTEYPCNECCNNYANQFEQKVFTTRQIKFLEMYPNTEIMDGIIDIMPCMIDKELRRKCNGCCRECQENYWKEEVEE